MGCASGIHCWFDRKNKAVRHSIISDRHSVLAHQRMSGLDGRGNMTPLLLPHSLTSASLFAALLFVSATRGNTTSTGAAASSSISYRTQQQLEVPTSNRANSAGSSNGDRSTRMVPAFVSAAAAGGWKSYLKRRRDGAFSTRTDATSIVSPRSRSGQNRECWCRRRGYNIILRAEDWLS